MVVALPSWLSGMTPCDLSLFSSASLPSWHHGQRSSGVGGRSSRVHLELSPFLCCWWRPSIRPPCRSSQSPGFWGTRPLPTLEALTRAFTSGEFPR